VEAVYFVGSYFPAAIPVRDLLLHIWYAFLD
jgi:hypothetical protein